MGDSKGRKRIKFHLHGKPVVSALYSCNALVFSNWEHSDAG